MAVPHPPMLLGGGVSSGVAYPALLCSRHSVPKLCSCPCVVQRRQNINNWRPCQAEHSLNVFRKCLVSQVCRARVKDNHMHRVQERLCENALRTDSYLGYPGVSSTVLVGYPGVSWGIRGILRICGLLSSTNEIHQSIQIHLLL